MTLDLDDLRARIRPLAADPAGADAADHARDRWATRAKPPGSLGRMEDLGVRLAAVTASCPPPVPTSPIVLVFAGDHGVVADGASAWPSEITGFMVATMAEQRAAISAFATSVGADVMLVDVGVAADLSDLDAVVHRKVRPGTDSLARGAAMTRDDAMAALAVGAELTTDAIGRGADLIVGGDMGIGNTTPSTALIAHFTQIDAATLVGPGAGLDAAALPRKRDLIAAAVDGVECQHDPIEVLGAIGGLEIAALAGMFLAAAAHRVPAVVDGVISCAGAVVADAIAPGTRDRLVAGHRSTEPAATAALEHLGLDPLLDLDLRLGEGTGACLAIPLVQAATRALRDMADLPA